MTKQEQPSFQRSVGAREYRPVFVVSMEGKVTEWQYFGMLDQLQSAIAIKRVRRRGTESGYMQILEAMNEHLKGNPLGRTDQAWIVMDQDRLSERGHKELLEWTKRGNHHLALSSPEFEYWILLHFEEGNDVKADSKACLARLKKYLPNYGGHINPHKKHFSLASINQAITRAKLRDHHRSDGSLLSYTTVYKLVGSILRACF